MSFKTKLDYSNNRQVNQYQFTSTQLSGTTVFGVDDVLIPIAFTGDTINIDALQYIKTRGIILPKTLPTFTGTNYQLLGRDMSTGKVVEVTGITGGTGSNGNDYTINANFNTSTGDLSFTRLSGGTYNVNLDGRYVTGSTATGLEAINEGNGIGWRLIGRNPLNYGNIGLNAIDFSDSTTVGNLGAIGEGSFAVGSENIASGIGAVAFGQDSNNSGYISLITGGSNINTTYASFINGYGNENSGGNGRGYNFITGRGNKVTGGFGQNLIGTGLVRNANSAVGTVVLGAANLDVNPSAGGMSDLTPMLIVGNGTHSTSPNGDWSSGTRSNLLVGLRNGEVTLPSTTISIINNEVSGRQIVTKEWVNYNFVNPSGLEGQIYKITDDNTPNIEAQDNILFGNYIINETQLDDSKDLTNGLFTSFADIISNWQRFSHGTQIPPTTTILSVDVPGEISELSTWSYNSGTQTISNSTNSKSYIGFISNSKVLNYTHRATLQSSSNDNDYISLVIAYVEDENEQVTNNAYGQSTPYANTTDPTVPRQHTLSLVRHRESNISTTPSYSIVYNYMQPDYKTIVSGSSLVWNTQNNWSGNSVDVEVVRNGNEITVRTSDFSDAPGGKGGLRFPLSFNLNDFPETLKFKGPARYGYGAHSQPNSTYTNVSFTGSGVNEIYDLRNGDVWIIPNQTSWVIDTSRTLNDVLLNKSILYNPMFENLLWYENIGDFTVLNETFSGGTGPIYTAGAGINISGTNVISATGVGASTLIDLTDVNSSTPTNRNVLVANGTTWDSRALTISDINGFTPYSSWNLLLNGGSNRSVTNSSNINIIAGSDMNITTDGSGNYTFNNTNITVNQKNINDNYTIIQSDNGKLLVLSATTPTSRIITVDSGLSEDFGVEFLNIGPSNFIFVGGTGNLLTPDGTILVTNKIAMLVQIGSTNNYYLKGELE